MRPPKVLIPTVSIDTTVRSATVLGPKRSAAVSGDTPLDMASTTPLVCQRIREYREQRWPRTSQEDVARGLGLSLSGYRKWENRTEPRERDRRRLALYYQSLGDDIPEDFFIRYVGERTEREALADLLQPLRDEVAALADRLRELEGQLADRPFRPEAAGREPSPG